MVPLKLVVVGVVGVLMARALSKPAKAAATAHSPSPLVGASMDSLRGATHASGSPPASAKHGGHSGHAAHDRPARAKKGGHG